MFVGFCIFHPDLNVTIPYTGQCLTCKQVKEGYDLLVSTFGEEILVRESKLSFDDIKLKIAELLKQTPVRIVRRSEG